jgi:E3 ubiquitin-protein ligase CCNP1IP1
MDQHLRCNSLRCRTVLTSQAVVTNCSHIFCVDWFACFTRLTLVQTNYLPIRGLVRSVNLLWANRMYILIRTKADAGRLFDQLESDRATPDSIVNCSDYKTVNRQGFNSRVCYPASLQQQCLKYSPAQWVSGVTKQIKKCYPSSSSNERTYQEYIAKTLQEKCNSLNAQLESLVRDSNTEITRLPHHKINARPP